MQRVVHSVQVSSSDLQAQYSICIIEAHCTPVRILPFSKRTAFPHISDSKHRLAGQLSQQHMSQLPDLAGENSKSLIRPSSAKLILDSLAVGSLIQILQPFIKASKNATVCCRVKVQQGERTQESASGSSRREQQEPDQKACLWLLWETWLQAMLAVLRNQWVQLAERWHPEPWPGAVAGQGTASSSSAPEST